MDVLFVCFLHGLLFQPIKFWMIWLKSSRQNLLPYKSAHILFFFLLNVKV